MKKTITVPPNVVLKNVQVNDEIKDVDYSFTSWLIFNPLASNAFGGNIDQLEACQQLIDTLSQAKPGDEVELDEDMWMKINQLVNYPPKPYESKLGVQLLPFLRAVRDAV